MLCNIELGTAIAGPVRMILPAMTMTEKLGQYRVGQKFGTYFVRLITSHSTDQFSNFFHWQNQVNICNNTLAKIPTHLNYVATIPCEISVSSKQQLKTRRLLQQHILIVRRPAARRTH